MPPVVTRFAPSPTGMLHLGGARTALFNWLFARHHGGRFLLRIEDTDRERSTPEATAAILEGLRWLGLAWDGEEVYQSQRLARHQAVAWQLLEQGKAYRCYATPEELEAMREKARTEGRPPVYDRRWRDAPPPAEQAPFVVRVKMPLDGETVLHDAVQGTVTVANSQLDDFVLLRADGTPTYMLAVVVDDVDMGITHIIRGDDHLNNAFRQYHLYQAMGATPPVFAHIPLIHGQDGAKLSKRHGAMGIGEYQAMGFLPEAMRNYLLRLGWGKGDADIVSTSEAVALFDIADVGKAPSRFDLDKLLHLNGHYLRNLPADTLFEAARPFLQEAWPDAAAHQYEWLRQGLPALQERARTLCDVAAMAGIYLGAPPLPRTEAATAAFTPDARKLLQAVLPVIETAPDFTHDALFALCKEAATAQGVKIGVLAGAMRIALTGDTASPSIFDIMPIIGRDETLQRLQGAA